MRLLVLTFILVGFGFSACKEYKLKQPAYLSFKWDFFNQIPGPHKAQITGGHFYLKGLKVTGTRAEGPPVEIEQDLPIMKTSFSGGGSLNLSMDVPVGDYNEFEVALRVTGESTLPCMVINGLYDNGSGNAPIPFRVEWSVPIDLKFHPQNPFTLKKKKSYTVTIGADVEQLFSQTTPGIWDEAIQTQENGVWTIVVRQGHNNKIYEDLEVTIPQSLIMKVQ
jgi:hypothetical protein